jgi:hypothetical protein
VADITYVRTAAGWVYAAFVLVHGELGHIPPVEYEALHAMTLPVTTPLETS